MLSIEPKIYILKGAVKSGKTTSLLNLIHRYKQSDRKVLGILNPVVDGIKYYVDLSTENPIRMESKDDDAFVKVGRYSFSQRAFHDARKVLKNHCSTPCDLFIIDEIGHLELQDQGLEPDLPQTLSFLRESEIMCIVLVVRERLVYEVIEKYNLQNATVISKEQIDVLL